MMIISFFPIKFLGWGTIYKGGPVSRTLDGVELVVRSDEECRTKLMNDTYTENIICAGKYPRKRSICTGDEGGPLLLRIAPLNKWHVVGIATYNDRCGADRKPSVFTRVSRFRTWIDDQIQVSIKRYKLK